MIPTVKKEFESTIAIGVQYGVTSFVSWSKAICNPQNRHHDLELEWPKTLLTPLKGELCG